MKFGLTQLSRLAPDYIRETFGQGGGGTSDGVKDKDNFSALASHASHDEKGSLPRQGPKVPRANFSALPAELQQSIFEELPVAHRGRSIGASRTAFRGVSHALKAIADASPRTLSSLASQGAANYLCGIDDTLDADLAQKLKQTKTLYLDRIYTAPQRQVDVAKFRNVALLARSLTSLDFSSTVVDAAAFRQFRGGLHLLHNLRHLKVEGCFPLRQGAVYVAGIPPLTRLHSLDYSNNRWPTTVDLFSTKNFGALIEMGSQLRQLSLRQMHHSDADFVPALQGIAKLKHLRVLDLGLNQLNRLAAVEQLARTIASLPALEELHLANITLGQNAFDYAAVLAGARGLKSLYLYNFKFEQDGYRTTDFSIALGGLVSLHTLEVTCSSLNAESSSCLANSLAEMKALKRINFSGNRFELFSFSDMNRALERLSWVEEFDFSSTKFRSLLPSSYNFFPTHSQLRLLHLSNTSLSEDPSVTISARLGHKSLRSLQSLSLAYSRLDAADLSRIVSTLERAPQLRFLDLSYNNLGSVDRWVTSKAIKTLVSVLPKLKNLEVLRLNSIQSTAADNALIAGALHKMSRLQQLTVDWEARDPATRIFWQDFGELLKRPQES